MTLCKTGWLSIIAAPALDRNREWFRLVSETQNLWPPFDHGRKCAADLWNCGRLSCPRCSAVGPLDHRCCCRHGCGMGFSSISAVMPLPTGWSGEFLAFASLSTRSAGPGIQKAGLLDSAGCSNVFLFLECRRRRPLCKRPARLPERLCGLQE